jgi:hypothetical protein
MRNLLRHPLGQTLLVGLLVAGTWAYFAFLFVPGYNQERVNTANTFGPYNSDLYQNWLPAREWFLHGRDPYSAEITIAVQQGVYGRVLAPDDPLGITLAFVFPAYLILLFGPLVLVPFDLLQPAVYVLIPLLLALTVVWWRTALNWVISRRFLVWLLLLATCTIPALYIFYLQQLTLLVVLFMAGAAACLARGRYGWAGVLLALATVKPQLCLVVILWLLAWAAWDWRRRGRLIIGFGTTMTLLVAGAFVVTPRWLFEWRDALAAYTTYATNSSILSVFLPAPLLLGVLAVIGLILAGVLWRARQAEPGSPAFSLGLALTCFYSLLLIPTSVFYNQLLLYPTMMVILQQRAVFAGSGVLGRVAYGAALACWLWFWLTAGALVLVWAAATILGGSDVAATVAGAWTLPWLSGLIVPTLLLLPLGVLVWRSFAVPQRQPAAGADALPW